MTMRFNIAFPHAGNISVVSHFSVVNMLMHERSKDKESCLLGSYTEHGSCHVPFNRNAIAAKFLNELTDDYLLMFDTDIQFNFDLLELFNAHISTYSKLHPVWDRLNHPHIISGRVDIGNGMPVFYKRMGEGEYKHDPRPFNGLKHFGAVGSGIIAISRWCLATIVNESRSYHFFGHLAETQTVIHPDLCTIPEHHKEPEHLSKMMSDDFSFCHVARKHGFMPYGAWNIRGIHYKTMPIRPVYYETIEEFEAYKKANPEGLPEWLRDENFISKEDEINNAKL